MTERLNRRRSMDSFIFGFFLLLSLFFLLGLSHHASMVTIFVRGPFSLSFSASLLSEENKRAQFHSCVLPGQTCNLPFPHRVLAPFHTK